MKLTWPTGVLEWGIALIVLLVTIHAPMSVWVSTTFPEFDLIAKAWKELLLLGLAVIAAALITKRKLWKDIFADRIIQLCLLFVVIHFLSVLVFGGDTLSLVAGLMIDLRFIALFVLAYSAVLMRPEFMRSLIGAAVLGAFGVIGFGLLQITVLPDDVLRPLGYSSQTITPFTTIDSNPDYVRINSTLRGPNPLGALAVVYAALLLAWASMRWRALGREQRIAASIGIAGIIAVLFASYSRSAYIGLAVAMGSVLAGSVRLTRTVGIGIVTGIVLLLGLGAALSTTDWYANVILHEDPESQVETKSNEAHVDSLVDGAARVIREPFGTGIGTTGSASLYDPNSANDTIVENYFFFVAHETGWAGLVTFVALLAAVLYRLWIARSTWYARGLFASGVGLTVIGVLLPVWADESVALIWWALAGATIASTSGIMKSSNATRTRKQKATRTP